MIPASFFQPELRIAPSFPSASVSTTEAPAPHRPGLKFVIHSIRSNNPEETTENVNSALLSPEPTVIVPQAKLRPSWPAFHPLPLPISNGIPNNIPSNQDFSSDAGKPFDYEKALDEIEPPYWWPANFLDPYINDDVEETEYLYDNDGDDDVEEWEISYDGEEIGRLDDSSADNDGDEDNQEAELMSGSDAEDVEEGISPTQTCKQTTITSTIYPSWYTP